MNREERVGRSWRPSRGRENQNHGEQDERNVRGKLCGAHGGRSKAETKLKPRAFSAGYDIRKKSKKQIADEKAREEAMAAAAERRKHQGLFRDRPSARLDKRKAVSPWSERKGRKGATATAAASRKRGGGKGSAARSSTSRFALAYKNGAFAEAFFSSVFLPFLSCLLHGYSAQDKERKLVRPWSRPFPGFVFSCSLVFASIQVKRLTNESSKQTFTLSYNSCAPACRTDPVPHRAWRSTTPPPLEGWNGRPQRS